jgi:hypothetical protein
MAMVGRRRRFGLGNVPIPGLSSQWSLGDPQSEMWGASYFNGSKVIGVIVDATSPSGKLYETADGQHTPWSQDTENAISAAANAAYGTYQRWEAIQTATPEMRAVLTDPEWIAHEDAGTALAWADVSPTLQAKIKAVPALYAQFTDAEQFSIDVAAGKYAAPAPAPSGPATYLVNGVEVYADGTPVPGGYNADADRARQLAEAQATASTGGAATLANATPTMTSNEGSQGVVAANPSSSGLPVFAPSGPAFDIGSGGASPSPTQLASGGGLLSSLTGNPLLLAGLVAAVAVIISRKRGR